MRSVMTVLATGKYYKKEYIQMDRYYGVIYYPNGNRFETGTYSGPGAAQICERATAQLFQQFARTATSKFGTPTRYEVKTK